MTDRSRRAHAAGSRGREQHLLDEVAAWYDSRHGLNRELIEHAAARILGRAGGRRALELGCAMGVMTEELVQRFPHLDVVEAAGRYASRAHALLDGKGRVYHCLFEDFTPEAAYDTIVMAWILEHVADPRALLSRARDWLSPGGRIHIVVPNAGSLHRWIGRQMGLLDRPDRLNDSDLAIGHRRVYTWPRLADDIAAAGLSLLTMDGLLLKPLPSALLEAWPHDLRAAFFAASSLAPRLCSEIYAVCSGPDHDHPAHPSHRLR